MWTIVLSLWAWFSKLGCVVKVVSWFPAVRQYWAFILIGVLVVWVGVLKYENLSAQNRYLKCQNALTTSSAAQNETKVAMDTKREAAAVIVQKNREILKQELKSVKKEESESDIDFLRRYL
jgi:hypothetical protein